MSDEGFLKRWSRRKRAETNVAAAENESAETRPSDPAASSGQALPPQAGEGSPVAPPRSGEGQAAVDATPSNTPVKQDDDVIDPATLPPLESLGPDSDYTVFLKKGVPEALRVAALRKAWMSDPFIRDFRGPAIDYGWDFTTPDYSLRATDNVAKMLDDIFAPQPTQVARASELPATPAAPTPAAPIGVAASQGESQLPRKQAEPPPAQAAPSATTKDATPPSRHRKHGGALPEDAN
jgi:hypothetical protein